MKKRLFGIYFLLKVCVCVWNLLFLQLKIKSCVMMERLEIKVVNRGRHGLPGYATVGSAGMDLRANLDGPIVLRSLDRCLVPTGLYMSLPVGFEAQVRPRSGLALKHGITVLNSPGTIDSDYRGEVGVLLINLSSVDFVVNDGDRIAQLVVARHECVDFVLVDDLDVTERGVGGYGSTGRG